jgi:hypothetical protein
MDVIRIDARFETQSKKPQNPGIADVWIALVLTPAADS